MNVEYYNFQGYRLVRHGLNGVSIADKILINTISPNSYGLAINNKRVIKALKGSDLLILDGLYFGWAPLFLSFIKIKRITGWDAFVFISNWMNQIKGKVFFLGSSEGTLKKIKQRYTLEYPNITVEYYSPPFVNEFSDEENDKMIESVNTFNPNILFIGMTAPKQEIWSYENKGRLNANIICTIGNVFDWYAGNSKRPSKIWIKLGLEWLVRIFLRPEIFKRNISNQLLFFWRLFLALLRIKAFE